MLLAGVLMTYDADAQSRRERFEKKKERPDVFETTFQKSFPTVWNIIKEAIVESDCQVEAAKPVTTDAGTFKGKIQSTFCVLVRGEDSTLPVLERYSERVPYIRAGVWTAVRMQYTFYVVENEDGDVKVKLKGEISGYETYVTSKFHYFDSNGMLEEQLFELVKKKVAAAEDE